MKLFALASALVLSSVLMAQPTLTKLKAIHDFTGSDGATPEGDLIFDADGNLYGVTFEGGLAEPKHCDSGCGTVFELSKTPDGGWRRTTLYKFRGGTDGGLPYAGLTIDGLGNLYGTAYASASGSGVVFELSLQPSGRRQFSVIHEFTGTFGQGLDGGHPQAKLLLDAAGNLYGTASSGGTFGTGPTTAGVVFELSPNPSGSWTETVLHNFTGGSDGGQPESGLIFDALGNMYSATVAGGDLSKCGGDGCGVVYELSPSSHGWTETVLHNFNNLDGSFAFGNLVFDVAGNLYGAAASGGNPSGCCGVIYELSPLGGTWTETVLDKFNPGNEFNGGYRGAGPFDLTMDVAGNLYGATYDGGRTGAYAGVVFKLSQTPTGWVETVLHAFYGNSDGRNPGGGVTFDSEGNLYGVTELGGDSVKCPPIGCGVVYELEP